jgi:hypothetical protein
MASALPDRYERRYILGMNLSSSVRTLIALLLCLLLPLQAGATLARAAAMARHAAQMPTAVSPAVARDDAAIPLLAHGGLHGGHHADQHGAHTVHAGHGGHAADAAHAAPHSHSHQGHHGDHGLKAPADVKPASKPASHQAVHAKAGCADCAKCCLMAASAPPPVLSASFAPAVARASFEPQRALAPAFLTSGPDRPPRHLTA